MPSNQMLADMSFPDLEKKGSTDEKFRAVQDYLFLLLEQLRYVLNNLTVENMNQTEWNEFTEKLTEPLRLQLKGLTIDVAQDGNTMTYTLGSNGMEISSTRCIELYSLRGTLPPAGLAGGVIVNGEGEPALSNGWYDGWDEGWDNRAVYVCSSYDGGRTWGSVVLRQGVSALSAMLDNNPYTFPGGTSSALAGQARVGVMAFLGDLRLPVTIGEITGQVDGLTTAVHDNGTEGAYFVATATSALTTRSGTLEIPVTAAGREVTLYWSWSVSYRGSSASVTFRNVNDALGDLFRTWSGGTPTTVSDAYIYSPKVKGGEFYGMKFYAGDGDGSYSEMNGTGFNLWTDLGFKAGIGYWTTEACEYPYLILGVGTGTAAAGAAIVQKLGAGIWIGDGCIVSAGGLYPGNESSPVSIASKFPNATGIFIDFDGDAIYRYINGAPSDIGSGGGGSAGDVYLVYS